MPELSPKLTINTLSVIGHSGQKWRCELKFSDGINVIQGENSLGKTTVLKLIKYILGARNVDFVHEIDQCDLVQSQVLLNDKALIIRRSLHEGKRKPSIQAIGLSHIQEENLRDFLKILLSELGIPLNLVPQTGKRALYPLHVEFSDLFLLMHISQEFGGSEIFEMPGKSNERMQKAIVETFLTLSGEESLSFEVQRSKLQAEKQAIEDEIEAYRKLIRELAIPIRDTIKEKIAELKAERDIKTRERENFRSQMRGDSGLISRLRSVVIEFDHKIHNLLQEIAFSEEKFREYSLSRNDIINEQQRIKRYDVSKNILSSFTFIHCPRCNQPITHNMRSRESEGHCMLCGQDVPIIQSVDLVKHLNDLSDEERELDQLIRRYEGEIKSKKAELEQLRNEKNLKDRELDEQMAENYTSAYVASLEAVNREIATIDEKIQQENTWLSISSKIDEKYQIIEAINTRIGELDRDIEGLRKRKTEDRRKLAALESYLGDFLRDVFRDFRSVEIDENTYLPIVNGLDYRKFSSVQINLTVIGYHYALLRYSLHHASRYPRFLLIDTPNKSDMDENSYSLMMRKFSELRKAGVPFQLIIATREIVENVADKIISLDNYLLQPSQLSLF